MEAVCSRTSNDVNLGTGIPTKFHIVSVRLYLEFTNSLWHYIDSRDRDAEVIVVRTINQKIVVASPLTVGGDSGRAGGAEGIRREQREVVHIAGRPQR